MQDTTRTKHGLQTATKLQDMLLARPARSMVSRQQQNYKTCCWHDPHEAWSPDSNKITRHAAGTTRTKHGLQTATKLQYIHTAGTTRTKHGLQTATKLQDMLLAWPARSMVSKQQQNYKTWCWHDPHEAWSPDNNNITRHAAGTTRTKHGLQTATKLQYIHSAGTTLTKHGLQTATKLQDMLLAQPARSMVSKQQQNYKTYCWHNPHEAWSPDSNNIIRHTAGINQLQRTFVTGICHLS